MPTTSQNPQANGMIECVHQVFENMLCTSGFEDNDLCNSHIIEEYITNTLWVVCSTYHLSLSI